MLRQKFDFLNGNESFNHVFANLKPRSPPPPGEGYFWDILGGGVQPGSSNPDTISDQKMLFCTSVFRPDLFSDRAQKKKKFLKCI